MDWTLTILKLIDLQTFTSFWYWLVVIVTWSIAGNWLIGVPFDILMRARKCPPQELADLEAIVEINVRRIVWTSHLFGIAMVALIAFFLCMLATMSFVYRIELAQGLLMLCAPMTIVVMINFLLAFQLHAAPLQGRDLVRRLFVVRLWVQIVAMISLFLSAIYGMYFAISSQHLF